MRTAVITDSNSGITQQQAEQLGVYVLPMPFCVNNVTYFEDINLTQEEFYQKLAENADIFTSQPSPEDVLKLWDKLLNEYDELVYIPMSSGLSSSMATALMLSEDYEGKVYVVNNQRISVTQLQSVIYAKELADTGVPAAEIREILEKEKLESTIYITVDTLKYLRKGGRLTPAVAALGTILKIKPVLQIQGEKLDTFAKARTMKQAKSIMAAAIQKDIETRFDNDASPENVLISIAHTHNLEAAKEFRAELLALFPQHHIYIDHLSLSVSCHIGPGALAVTATHKNGCKWDGSLPWQE